KMSGASCIELNSRVHEFVSGNGSHPLPVRISEVLSWTFITLNTIGNRVRSVYLSKMNSDEVVKMLQEHRVDPETRSIVSTLPDERVALVGRHQVPVLVHIFIIQMKVLPVTEGKPVRDFKDVFDFGIRNRVALEETGDPTREAALYSCIAASLLRLFTKPASNYVSSWSSIVKSFSKFYDEPMNVALPNPIQVALEIIDSRFAFGEAEKVTLYRFLYMSNSDESHKELKKFLYDIFCTM
nr:hypothetical protein [Tanacetum cinerariifolium]